MVVGDIISHAGMCGRESRMLRHGMNFCPLSAYSVLLMSRRPGAPYDDTIVEESKILIYEGHDVPRAHGVRDPKSYDQSLRTPRGRLTANGQFYEAAQRYKQGLGQPRLVRVYEKIKDGIWTYNGVFRLIDAWEQKSGGRKVFKYRLEITNAELSSSQSFEPTDHSRLIPAAIKREVFRRDKGQCVVCGSKRNLHFDHDFPYSKGGTSLSAKNIRLLCMSHNLAKGAKVE